MPELAHGYVHYGALGWVFPFLWFFLIVGVVLFFKRSGGCGRRREAGESVLAERYARGEISEEEYRERRAILREVRR